MDKKFFKLNRDAFFSEMEEDSIAVFFSGIFHRDTNDQLVYPFSVDRNFFYFTGIDKDNMMLILCKSGSSCQTILFIPPVDEMYEKWQARMMRPAEAAELSGIGQVLYTYDFEKEFEKRIYPQGALRSAYIFTNYAEIKEEPTLYQRFAQKILGVFPTLRLLNPMPILTELRASKRPEEIALIQQAESLCMGALTHSAANLKPGLAEYQIKANYIHFLQMHGSQPRFRSVVAAGKNATILHYNEASYITQTEDMVLMDVGAMHEWYVSDLTRTFPVSGKFTSRQREVYDIVLEAMDIGMSELHVGNTEFAVNKKIKAFYAQALKTLKLIEFPEEVEKYYFHGSGHPIGLDLHDYRTQDRVFPENCVHTMEPGLYIPEWSIGIRIEDNVLIRKDGVTNLSADLPRSANDIENMVGTAF